MYRLGKFTSYILIGLLLSLGMLACSSSTPPPQGEATEPVATVTVATTATLPPTPTPTPPPSLVILLTPPGSDGAQAAQLQEVLSVLSAQEGLLFETRSELLDNDLQAGVRLVVALPPDSGLAELTAANPEIQFLAVGIPGLQPAPNLSVIGAGGDRPDRQGFLAGYLAAVITRDWRVGVVIPSDLDSGQFALQGFQNGLVFYCGLCRPAYPPYYQYPVFAEVTSSASLEEQRAAADIMIANAVESVYIYPGAGSEGLFDYLAQAGIKIIGGVEPPPTVLNQWVASIRVDWESAIREAWLRLIQGEGGFSLEAPITLTDRNENNFSPGRQEFVERLLEDLLADYIDTGAAP